MNRILGIDYGTKYIGLALSDQSQKMAFPDAILENRFAKIKKTISNLIKEKNVSRIVIGLPKDYNGKANQLTKEVLNFTEKIKKEFNLPVGFIDERFTSANVRRIFGKNAQSHNKAACLILETYLRKQKNKN